MATHQEDVVRVQKETQDRWTVFQNFTARLRQTAVPTRRIIHELSLIGVEPSHSQRVLDFGFGHGNMIFWFKPPTEIYGIELSSLALENAKKRAKKRGYLRFAFDPPPKHDSVAIEHPNDYFDCVLTSHALEHVEDDARLLREFCRVLKPGGRLLVCVPHGAKHEVPLLRQKERRNPDFPEKTYHVWMYNVATLQGLLTQNGFKVIKAERFNAVKNQRRGWPRPVQVAHIAMLAMVPYSIFSWLDTRACAGGHSASQIITIAKKVLGTRNLEQ